MLRKAADAASALGFSGFRVESLEPRTLLSSVAWDGGGDGVHWTDPLNWSSDVLPGANDDVTIGSAFTVESAGNVSIKSVTSTGHLSILSGSFGVSGGTLAGFGIADGRFVRRPVGQWYWRFPYRRRPDQYG